MIVAVCLNLLSLYSKITIALCDNMEELKKENKFDEIEYCDDILNGVGK